MKDYRDKLFCNWCGAKVVWNNNFSQNSCSECNYIDFPAHKPCASLILKHEDNILLLQRAIDPKKGMYDLPGGFVDITDKSIESALAREIKEELSLEIKDSRLEYLCSSTDKYKWCDIDQDTIIMFFVLEISKTEKDAITLSDENSEFIWTSYADYEKLPLAWDCDKIVLYEYMELGKNGKHN